MTTENKKYNGWTNYETWLLYCNLSNDNAIYNSMDEYYTQNFEQDDEITHNDANDFKAYLEEMFFNKENNLYELFDSWTVKEWHEINFKEVLQGFKPDPEEW